MRRRLLSFTSLGFASFGVTLLALTAADHRPSNREPLEELLAVLGPVRPTEGRLAGVDYAPYERGKRYDLRCPACLTTVRRIEADLARARSGEHLNSAAIVSLLRANVAEATALLEEATEKEPANAAWWSNLAAAYLEEGDRRGDPVGYLSGLAAAENAVARQGGAVAACNRALALGRSSILWEEPEAWRLCLSRETDPAWRRHSEEELELAAEGRAPGKPPGVRRRVIEDLLGGWAAAVLRRDPTAAARSLRSARDPAEEVRRATGDGLLVEALDAIESPSATSDGEDPLLALAEGHQHLLAGLRKLGRYEVAAAESSLRLAAGLLLHHGSPLALEAERHLALCSFRKGAYREAAARLRAVTGAAREKGYQHTLASALLLEGLVAFVLADYDHALESYGSALRIAEAVHDEEGIAGAHQGLFEYYHIIGDPQAAWLESYEALHRLCAVQDSRRRQLLLEGAGIAASDNGHPRVALYFQDAALREAEQTGQPTAVAAASMWRASLRHRAGLSEEALADVEAARRNAAAIHDDTARENFLADLSRVEGEILGRSDPTKAADRLSAAVESYRRTSYGPQLPETYLQLSRVLGAAGRKDEQARTLREAVAEVEAQRPAVPAEERVSFLDRVIDIYDELALLEAESGGDADRAFQIAEEGRAQLTEDLLSARNGLATSLAGLDLRQVAARLPARTVLVEYAVFPSKMLVWRLSRYRTSFLVREIGEPELCERVAAFRRAIERDDESGIRGFGTELAGVLLGAGTAPPPLAEATVIVPDGCLHELPFAALWLSQSSEYLVAATSLVVAPSARLYLASLANLGSRPVSVRPRLLAVGNPSFDSALAPGLGSLPMAGEEARRVGDFYPGATVLTGSAATHDALLLELGRHEIAHIAAHVLPASSNSEYARLLLAPAKQGETGLVYAAEISGLQGPMPGLVVLNACGGSAGRLSRSEGSLSLALAFLRAGVPQVVATLWEVEDSVASRLAVEIHEELSTSRNPALALAEAQRRSLASSDPALSRPRAWSGYQLLAG